jgi:hypothetical protein
MESASEFVQRFRRSRRALDASDKVQLSREEFRIAVYKEILAADTPEDRPLILQLVEDQIARHTGPDGGYCEDFGFCAFLLATRRDVADAPLLWRAKSVSFDTHMGLQVAFLVGAGVAETVGYLRGLGTPEGAKAAEYIEECRACGNLDRLDELYADYRSSFAAWIIEPDETGV